MIDVKGLKKNYGGLQVLKGVDLTIDKGDCVVLVMLFSALLAKFERRLAQSDRR